MGDPATTTSGLILKSLFLTAGAGAVGAAGVAGAKGVAGKLAPDIRFPKPTSQPPPRRDPRDRIRRRLKGRTDVLTSPLGLSGGGSSAAKTLLGG